MDAKQPLTLTIPIVLVIFIVFLALGFGALGVGLGWTFYEDRLVAEKALREMQEERDKHKANAEWNRGVVEGMVTMGAQGRPGLIQQFKQLEGTIDAFKDGLEKQGKVVKGSKE